MDMVIVGKKGELLLVVFPFILKVSCACSCRALPVANTGWCTAPAARRGVPQAFRIRYCA